MAPSTASDGHLSTAVPTTRPHVAERAFDRVKDQQGLDTRYSTRALVHRRGAFLVAILLRLA